MVRVGLELVRRDMIDYGTDWVRLLVSEHIVKIELSVMAISKKSSVIEPGDGRGAESRYSI